MRCRKVRSFLSAYCNDELSGNRRRQVSEHLLACPGCRRQEEFYRGMNETVPEMSSLKVSDGFNERLLKRVAQERFAETRTKAHLPKAAPLFLWRRVVPVAATACVALLAVFATLSPTLDDAVPQYANSVSVTDNDYLTAQPTNNPNLTVQLNKDWSLTDQLARNERIHRISNSVIPAGSFSRADFGSGMGTLASADNQRTPFVGNYYRLRPVVRVYYVVPQSSGDKEGSNAF